jgi:hypothetical protein
MTFHAISMLFMSLTNTCGPIAWGGGPPPQLGMADPGGGDDGATADAPLREASGVQSGARSAEQDALLGEQVRRCLVGMCIGDALAMPLHW